MNTGFIINKPFAKGIKIPVQLFLNRFGIFSHVYKASVICVNNNSELTACGIHLHTKGKVEDPKLSLEVCHKTTYQGKSIPYQGSQ